jgi:hypothetical protein
LYDALTFPIMWRDFSEFYAARVERRAALLPSLALTYLEYAAEQRAAWPTVSAVALPYWRDVIDGSASTLTWPPTQGWDGPLFEAHKLAFGLDADSSAHLLAVAARARVPPFLVLLTATGLAVSQVVDESDILVSTYAANRTSARTRNVMGPVLNAVITRFTTGNGSPPFDTVLREVRESWLAAEAYEGAYFDQVLKALGVAPPPNVVEMEPGNLVFGPTLAGVRVSPSVVESQSCDWRHLIVRWRHYSQGYMVEVLYRPAVVAPEAAARVARETQRLLETA